MKRRSAEVFTVALFLLFAIACSGSTSEEPSASQATEESDDKQSDLPKEPDDSTSASTGKPDLDAPATAANQDKDESTSGNDDANQATSEPGPVDDDVIAAISEEEKSQMTDIQTGQQYNGGTRVNSPDLGLSFVVPDEWLGGLPQGAEAFVMGSNTRAGIIVVLSQRSSSIDEVVDALSQPLPLDQGVILQPVGQPEVDGPWVRTRVTTSDGSNNFEGYAIALVREKGLGIFIVGVGPEGADYYQQVAASLASSTRVTTVSVASNQAAPSSGPGGQDSSQLAQEWQQFFNGMRATYLSSFSSGLSGGSSEKVEYDLCSDGQFAYSSSSSLSIDTGGASAFSGGSSANSGTWRIVTQGNQAFMELAWSDGDVSNITLEFTDDKTYFNGSRYFITPDNTTCR